MNVDVYIFGEFSKGYSQYPNNNVAEAILKNCISHSKSASQMVVHRENNLLYYSYVRQLHDHRTLGFCLVTNNSIFADVRLLFSFFEESIDYLANNGSIICFNSDADITTKVNYLDPEQVGDALSYIKGRISDLETGMVQMPPLDYSIVRGKLREFIFEDDNSAMTSAANTVDYVVIHKDYDINNLSIDSSAALIKQLAEEKKQLKAEKEQLAEEKRALSDANSAISQQLENALKNQTQSYVTSANNSSTSSSFGKVAGGCFKVIGVIVVILILVIIIAIASEP